jgi:hypothetical protein
MLKVVLNPDALYRIGAIESDERLAAWRRAGIGNCGARGAHARRNNSSGNANAGGLVVEMELPLQQTHSYAIKPKNKTARIEANRLAPGYYCLAL